MNSLDTPDIRVSFYQLKLTKLWVIRRSVGIVAGIQG